MRSEKESKLYEEYLEFLRTDKGKQWKTDWEKHTGDNKNSGDFGDYLYDFYPEMVM